MSVFAGRLCCLCVSKVREETDRLISRGKQSGCKICRGHCVSSSLSTRCAGGIRTSIMTRQSTFESSHCMWCPMVLALTAFSMFLCAPAVAEEKGTLSSGWLLLHSAHVPFCQVYACGTHHSHFCFNDCYCHYYQLLALRAQFVSSGTQSLMAGPCSANR